MKLTVRRTSKEEVFSDTARVFEEYRKTPSGEKIKSGAVCKIRVNGRSWYAVIRGTPDETVQHIYMDDYLRDDLNLKKNLAYDFAFHPAGLWGSVVWTWKATDPVYRVASRMSVLSLALGILSLILAIIPFWDQIQLFFEHLRSILGTFST